MSVTTTISGIVAFYFLLAGAPFSEAKAAESNSTLGFDDWLTFSGNFDAGYRQTQFFEPHHDAAVGQWDSRAELWLPPFRTNLSWGPYVRVAGIVASRSPAWENAWLAGPGLGFQAYPFSFPQFREGDSLLGKMFGPLRLFGEYNWQDYWGSENTWRPDHQVRVGAEYWKALNVNDYFSPWWLETWSGLYWQSANEFDPHYDTLVFANALRAGMRARDRGFLSAFSPYAAVESSLTGNDSYYWENRLLVGGGLRLAPSLLFLPKEWEWLNRFVIYAEYLHTAAYYRQSAPSSVPDYDVRAGVSFSIGEWYH
jgi:hypothetical protein